MTWRERLLEGRQLGDISRETRNLWLDHMTCMAGDAVRELGIEPRSVIYDDGWFALWSMGTKAHRAALDRDFDAAERWLDTIEDTALELKRAAGPINAPASAASAAPEPAPHSLDDASTREERTL